VECSWYALNNCAEVSKLSIASNRILTWLRRSHSLMHDIFRTVLLQRFQLLPFCGWRHITCFAIQVFSNVTKRTVCHFFCNSCTLLASVKTKTTPLMNHLPDWLQCCLRLQSQPIMGFITCHRISCIYRFWHVVHWSLIARDGWPS